MTPQSTTRILIVDDEYDLREILKVKFEKSGFEVLTASEGGEAFEKVRAEHPDCILLDVRVHQGEDGLSFLRRLRAYRGRDDDPEEALRRIPVIILTAAGENMRSLFEIEGISGYFSKPFDSQQLIDKIHETVKSQSS